MRGLDAQQIAILEQQGHIVDRDANGNVVSVTQVVEPPPLLVSDAEYLADLFQVRDIMRVMHMPLDAQEA